MLPNGRQMVACSHAISIDPLKSAAPCCPTQVGIVSFASDCGTTSPSKLAQAAPSTDCMALARCLHACGCWQQRACVASPAAPRCLRLHLIMSLDCPPSLPAFSSRLCQRGHLPPVDPDRVQGAPGWLAGRLDCHAFFCQDGHCLLSCCWHVTVPACRPCLLACLLLQVLLGKIPHNKADMYLIKRKK